MKNKVVENELINYVKKNTNTKDYYWYPMTKTNSKIPVIAYDLELLYLNNKIKLLEKVFKRIRAKYVDTFCMDNKEYFENDNIYDLLNEKNNKGDYTFPKYVETYYLEKSNKWMVYISHEGTITFTGKSIVKIANKIIPKKYLYHINEE